MHHSDLPPCAAAGCQKCAHACTKLVHPTVAPTTATAGFYNPVLPSRNIPTIKNVKAYYSDVDDTLAMGNLSDYPESEQITVEYVNGPVKIVPNKKMINLLTYFHKLGYAVIVWSKTGGDWAEAVSKALGIDPLVSAYLPKPMFYGDDQPVEAWIGPRRYRDCKETLK